MALTPTQENLLEQVRLAHAARANARRAAEVEARELIAKRIAVAEEVESRAVRAAMAGGVSRRKVGIEGLGTSDYHTVTKVLDVTRDEFERAAEQEERRARQVHLVPPKDRSMVKATIGEVPGGGVPVARVDWEQYADGVDLHGYVRLADSGDYWIALVDDTDSSEGAGDGPLWFEARGKGRLAERLRELLNEF